MTSPATTEGPLDGAAAELPPDVAVLPSVAARHACRAGMASSTAGVAGGFVQGNLAILP